MGGLVLLICIVVMCTYNVVEYIEHHAGSTEEFMEIFVLTAVLLATLPMVILMAWRTSGRLLRPLVDIQESLQEIRGGDLDRRLKVEGADDALSYLVDSLNEAFDAHQHALDRLQQFSADVSHQLRTPLTAMSTEGQLALCRERKPDEYRETLGRLLEQAENLSKVVDQLLLLAKVSSAGGDPLFETVDLRLLNREMLNEFIPYVEDRGAEWMEETAEGELILSGNPWWLREALSNLINNALQYSPDPAKFRLRILREGECIIWQLEDSGPGIPEDQRERIFKRFQRGKSGADHGTGLGLAIVQEVVRLHGGTISLEESPLGGCLFKLSFPVLQNPEPGESRES